MTLYTHRLGIRVALLSLFLAIAFLACTSTGKAQACPPGYVGPFTTTFVLFSSNCGHFVTVTVRYCHTADTVAPPGYYIQWLRAPTDMGVDCIDTSFFRDIGELLIEQNLADFDLCNEQNCPRVELRVEATWENCHTTFQSGPNQYVVPCGVASQACGDFYAVCCRCNGSLQAFYRGSLTSDECESTGDPNCMPTCPTPGTPQAIVCPGALTAPEGKHLE